MKRRLYWSLAVIASLPLLLSLVATFVWFVVLSRTNTGYVYVSTGDLVLRGLIVGCSTAIAVALVLLGIRARRTTGGRCVSWERR